MEFFMVVFVYALSTTVTPGPNNIMILSSGLNHGIRNTLPHFLGVCLGFPVMVAAVGFGLSAMFLHYPIIHQILKFAGISYLLYLAWKIAMTDVQASAERTSKPMTFLQAAAFQWLNPKAWIMGIGAVATFTTVSGNIDWQVMVIAFSFLLVSFPCVGSWLFFGAALKKILKSPRDQKIFNVTMAILLILSVIPMMNASLSNAAG